VANPNQRDEDHDEIGDLCEAGGVDRAACHAQYPALEWPDRCGDPVKSVGCSTAPTSPTTPAGWLVLLGLGVIGLRRRQP
jgi:MYXO-CTERM domain-containing protein